MKHGFETSAMVCVLAAILVPAVDAPAQPQALTLDQVRDDSRAALGFTALQQSFPKGWVLDGSMRFAELDRTATFASHPNGSWSLQVAGDFATSYGFDGAVTWMRDLSADVRRLDPADSEPLRMAAAILSQSWLSDNSPVTCESVEFERGRGLIQVGMHCVDGAARARLTIDAVTHQPTRLTVFFAGDEEYWEFGEYRKLDSGVTMPMFVLYSDFSDNTFTTRFTGLRAAAAADSALWVAPQPDPNRVTFDPAADPVVKLQRINRDKRFFAHVLINGKPVGPFIVSTSTEFNLISPQAAADAGMEMAGLFHYRASGDDLPARFRKAQTLQVGAMTIRGPAFIQGDFTFDDRLVGQSVAGILGYNTFAHAVTEFDIADMELRFQDPASYALSDRAAWQPLTLNHFRPQVACSFEGNRTGLFNIEPSINSWLEINGPTVLQYNLLGTREVREGVQAAAGAMRKLKIGKLEWFEIAGDRISDVQTGFFEGLKGWAGDPFTAGTVGSRVLDKYRMVFDYSNRRAAFIDK